MEYEKNPQAEKLKTYFGKLVEVMELLENVAEVIKDKDAAERKKILEAKAKELGVESLLTTKESS